jgi:uncharacterized integral membrane protein
MPWRLIGFVVLFAIFLAFIGLNLENRCDISFGFTILPQVPVYLTAFSAFVLGILWAIPFVISFRRKKAKRDSPKDLPGSPSADTKTGKFPFGKKKNIPPEFPAVPIDGDGGPYGID